MKDPRELLEQDFSPSEIYGPGTISDVIADLWEHTRNGYPSDIGYHPVDLKIRFPERSELEWTEPVDGYWRPRKAHPPVLLDRLAGLAVSDRDYEAARNIDNVYLKIVSEEDEAKMVKENDLRRSGVRAVDFLGEVKFERYRSRLGEPIDFETEPEDRAYTDEPEPYGGDPFEDLTTERGLLVSDGDKDRLRDRLVLAEMLGSSH